MFSTATMGKRSARLRAALGRSLPLHGTRLLATGLLTLGLLIAPGALTPASAAPGFQLPFPCAEVWSGQTRSKHSPANSVDFNHYPDDYGWKVLASAAGKVTVVGYAGADSYGYWIEIDHGGGWRTRYAHLSAQNVRVGQHVARGTFIGRVGSTGNSTGPHLHYEQRLNGDDVKATFNGSRAYYWGTKNYTSHNCGGSTNPYTATQVCGSGYTVIDSHAIRGARVYLAYNASTGKNCVTTLKTTKLGTKTKVGAKLAVKGGSSASDSGKYGYYAGPVRKKAVHTCVKWGGSTASGSFTSAWSHCG